MRQIIVCVAGVVSIIVVACSSSDQTSDIGGKNTKTNDDASVDASTPSDKSGLETKDSSAPPPKTCSNGEGAEACFACCEEKSPGGASVYDQAMRTCLCGASACATECAESVCAEAPTDPTDGDDCSTCIDDAAECEQQADTACAASAACAALADCIEQSECEPDADGGT